MNINVFGRKLDCSLATAFFYDKQVIVDIHVIDYGSIKLLQNGNTKSKLNVHKMCGHHT